MKRKLTILISIGLTSILSGCSFFSQSIKHISTTSLTEQSSNLAKYDISYSKESILNIYNKYISVINDTSSYKRSDFISKANSFIYQYVSIINKYKVARVRQSADYTKENTEKVNDLYSFYYELYTKYLESEKKIYTSQYKKDYFGDMTDKEIEERIYGQVVDDTTKKLEQDLNDIQDRFQEVYKDTSLSKDEYISKSLDLYREYMDTATKLSTHLGYSSYLDYAYKVNYEREYTPTKVDSFSSILKSKMIPFAKTLSKKSVDSKYENLYYGIRNYNFMNSSLKCNDILAEYTSTVDSSYRKAYNHFFKDGYYYFSDKSTSYGTAYIDNLISTYSGTNDEPLAFFSANYQNISTFVHEFGHYITTYLNSNTPFSYDVCETQSQSNELLFANYQTSYMAKDETASVYSVYEYNEMYDMIASSLKCCAVAEIENYCFKNQSLSKQDMLDGINEIISDYDGFISESYWCYPCIESSGYYISYSVSGFASLSLYVQSKNDFNKAKSNYMKLVKYNDTEHMTLDEIYKNSEIKNPFEETTIDYLIDNIKNY